MRSDTSRVEAPQDWRVVDFISDLHLQAAEPQTFEAWARYMRNTRADAVFILGDLFEVWVGDDAVAAPGTGEGFDARCVSELRRFGSARGLFLMHGNRDFLIGQTLMRETCATLLDDPCVLVFGGRRWLLSHGDALCLADTDYQAFRRTVRSPAWQQEFLAKPLAERQQIARHLRLQSQALQRARMASSAAVTPALSDIDEATAIAWLEHAGTDRLIHGHTHRPADHALGNTASRSVLSDWDLTATPPRAEIFRLAWAPGGLPVSAARVGLDQA